MLKEVLDIVGLAEGNIHGEDIAAFFRALDTEVHVTPIDTETGHTDFIKIIIPGTCGKISGGSVPTLGIIGRLGGIGARPEIKGMVSDADGAVTALASALKLVRMAARGDRLECDVIICTHICPNAPTQEHYPVPFMGSPVDMLTLNRYEIDPAMDAIITADTTKGNIVLNSRGIAITPTVKNGYILPVSNRMLEIMSYVTGKLPCVLPISQYDITPYGNNLPHINSILQPAVATEAPVLGLAIVTQSAVPGCATGASHETDIAEAATFCVEVAKTMKDGTGSFYSAESYERAALIYGELGRFRNMPEE